MPVIKARSKDRTQVYIKVTRPDVNGVQMMVRWRGEFYHDGDVIGPMDREDAQNYIEAGHGLLTAKGGPAKKAAKAKT